MTEIAFHFGAPHKLAYACRLLRKACASGAWVTVTCAPDTQETLSAGLWALSPTDFVPHCNQGDAPEMQTLSAVLLTTDLEIVPGHRHVLVNLRDTIVAGYEHFGRLIEVVSTDQADRQNARERWRHYSRLGYTLVRHDLNLQGGRE